MTTPVPVNHVRTTPLEILRAIAGSRRRIRDDGRAIVGATTDSRTVTPGCAFFALRGEYHDGHDFVGRAVNAGATLVVIEAGHAADAGDADVVEVADTLAAWGAFARARLRSWRAAQGTGAAARTVAITGSAGKTTTKELCARLLTSVGRCHATPGNLNNRVGVPAVALGIADDDRFAVFEVGMSLPGEIAALAGVVEPDVAVLLNVGVAHAGGVGGTRANVAREKGALLEALAPTGCAVVSADDAEARGQTTRTRARVETFGRAAGARYRLVDRIAAGERGSRVLVDLPRRSGPERIELGLPLPGEASALDLVAALAAAEAAAQEELPLRLLEAAVAGISSVAGRAALRTLPGNILVLDDTYNANPASMRAALETLVEVARSADRRRVVVLGEMRELGPLGPSEHEQLGDAIAAAGAALAIGCGGLIDLALDRAAESGVHVVKAPTTEAAADVAVANVRAGDAVLLKGSRGVAVERVWEALVRRHGDPAPGADA